tara:strand:- start:1045 stop:1503 length:459 start_codon:yes stop_codon:yes gene_type:complete
MKQKIFLFFLVIFFINNCGYSPLHLNREKLNMEFLIVDYRGDYQINSVIRSKLSMHKSDKVEDLIKININTKYEKNDFSKDTSGNIEDYELIALTEFELDIKGSPTKISFDEKFIIKNFADDFEEDSYEKEIKDNFANSIYNKLINHILQTL